MNELFEQHLRRLELSTTGRLTRKDLAKWVCKETFINGKPYSFVGHEFQERIMSQEAQVSVIRKCSQVGASEMSLRRALGMVAILKNFSSIYILPTASFASLYVKTRLDPIIAESPFLRNAVRGNSAIDSSEVKQLGANGFLYFRGASSDKAAISVAADALTFDEFSFADQTIVTQFMSRLTHSPYKIRDYLSTPTFPGDPIDEKFQESRRHWQMVRCHHQGCGHVYVPNYYSHVKIPGYGGDLRAITSAGLHKVRWQEAALLCPHCGKPADLSPANREWVCENPSENHVAIGHQIQPFDAPSFISIPSLIQASTTYARRADFDNFNLGLPAEDAESGITAQDVDGMKVQMLESPFHTHVIGGDMGLICRIIVAGVSERQELVVVHKENVPIERFRTRYFELCTQFRVTSKVLDAQPYVETVLHLQDSDQTLAAAYFVKKKGLELYQVTTREENEEEGKTPLRQVSVNRNAVFDVLLDDIRNGLVKVRDSALFEEFKSQLLSMKRQKLVTEEGLAYQWVKAGKTSGKGADDHWHFALLYAWIAARLRGVSSGSMLAPAGVSTFKLIDPKTRRRN